MAAFHFTQQKASSSILSGYIQACEASGIYHAQVGQPIRGLCLRLTDHVVVSPLCDCRSGQTVETQLYTAGWLHDTCIVLALYRYAATQGDPRCHQNSTMLLVVGPIASSILKIQCNNSLLLIHQNIANDHDPFACHYRNV